MSNTEIKTLIGSIRKKVIQEAERHRRKSLKLEVEFAEVRKLCKHSDVSRPDDPFCKTECKVCGHSW